MLFTVRFWITVRNSDLQFDLQRSIIMWCVQQNRSITFGGDLLGRSFWHRWKTETQLSNGGLYHTRWPPPTVSRSSLAAITPNRAASITRLAFDHNFLALCPFLTRQKPLESWRRELSNGFGRATTGDDARKLWGKTITILWCIILYYIVLYYITIYTVLCYIILYCIVILYYTVLYCIVLYNYIYCIVLYYTI